jgi:hypothetical protein
VRDRYAYAREHEARRRLPLRVARTWSRADARSAEAVAERFLGFARSSQHSLIGVLLIVFSSRMISEVVQPSWEALQRGEFITGAAESVGSYRVQGRRWIVAAGGVRPRRGRDLQGRYLSFSERE